MSHITDVPAHSMLPAFYQGSSQQVAPCACHVMELLERQSPEQLINK